MNSLTKQEEICRQEGTGNQFLDPKGMRTAVWNCKTV